MPFLKEFSKIAKRTSAEIKRWEKQANHLLGEEDNREKEPAPSHSNLQPLSSQTNDLNQQQQPPELLSLTNDVNHQQQPPEESVSFQLGHLIGTPTISIPKRLFVSPQDMEYLDRGSFGDVYKFTEVSGDSAGNSVAIKSIRFTKEAEEEKISVEKEISVHMDLLNPHIVQYIGSHAEAGNVFILMEFMTGGSLKTKINRTQELATVIPALLTDDTLKYVREILTGLCYLHEKKVIHRDLRAANVLLDSNDIAKLADFGISKKLDTLSTRSQFQTKVGNLYWHAPEIIKEEMDITGRSVDIWSLGITILEMIFVRPKFMDKLSPYQYMSLHIRGKDMLMTEIDKNIITDVRLSEIVRRCLTYESDSRPSSTELLEIVG